jgi:CheY-like chemotaxis protein
VQLAAERAAALTRQLLAFSRRQVLEPRVLNINDTVRGLEPMLRRTLGEDIEVEVHTAEDLGNTVADPTQLEQVIMNLVVNARDAMAGGGRLTIETCNVELDASYANEHMTVEPGAYVQLSVSDTGAGMDAETRSHVFEPFFSTKEAGKGTGLGLSTVYGIVKQTGGNVWVYSEPGQGTTFKVYLPRVDAPVAAEPRRASASSPTGHETVLVVEDEPAVRRVAERVMRQAGYRVLSAADGREALSVFDRQQGAVDLLLTDVVMPSMGGRELVDRLRERRPDLKVIFTSGYADSALLHRGVLDSSTRFLNKPFTAEALMRKARRVLDGDE